MAVFRLKGQPKRDGSIIVRYCTTGLYSWGQSGLDWSSTTTVTVRLQRPTPPDDPPDPDDFPADTTTGQVDDGGSLTGTIGTTPSNDTDWFLVELDAGTRYQIDLEGASTARGTVPDSIINAVRDAGGNTITGTVNDDSGIGNNARTIFTATASGVHYIDAGSVATTDTGTYTLSVIVLGANGASEADTDFPDTTATSGRVEVGASVTGNIGTDGDADWFRVDLEAGKTYQIDLEGPYNGRGTLEDPLLKLLNESGVRIALDDDGGATFDSKVIYAPTTTGTYYVEAIEAGGGVSSVTTGTYTLSVRDITPDDPRTIPATRPKPISGRATPTCPPTPTPPAWSRWTGSGPGAPSTNRLPTSK